MMLKKLMCILFIICLMIANIYIPVEIKASDEKTFGEVKQDLADINNNMKIISYNNN